MGFWCLEQRFDSFCPSHIINKTKTIAGVTIITSSTTNIKDVGTVVYSIDESALSILQSLKLSEPEKLDYDNFDHVQIGFSRSLEKPFRIYGQNISRVEFYVIWTSDSHASLGDDVPLPNEDEYGGWYNFRIDIITDEPYDYLYDEANYNVVEMSIHECEATKGDDFVQKMFDGCLEFLNSI